MITYLLSVHGGDTTELPDGCDEQRIVADVERLNHEIQQAGAWVFAGGLHPADTATVVSDRDGDVVTTDGPYLDTEQHLAGFWVIRAAHLDEALEWARHATVACRRPVEVRPFVEDVRS